MAGARRNLLEIVKDAGADIGVLGGITALSTDNTEQRMVNAAIRRTGTDICRAGLVIREHSFYTVSGTAVYALPTDYFLPWINTTWNSSDKWSLRNINQREWQANKSGFTASSVHQRFMIQPMAASQTTVTNRHFAQREFHIDPTPTSAEKVVFNYRSDHWVEGLSIGPKSVSDITLSGTDELIITSTAHGKVASDVVTFYGVGGTTELNGKQFSISSSDLANTFTLLGTNSADFTAHTSGGSFDVNSNIDGITATSGVVWYPLVPDELVEAGIAWRLRQRMGMSYFEHKAEYDELLATFVGAAQGEHIINLSGPRLKNYVGVPDGNFPSS